MKRAPTDRFTYGLRGSSILAALFNAVFLLLTTGAISWEAIRRLGSLEPVAEKTVMIVAAAGILINGVTAWLFASGSKDDFNLRGAFLHMAIRCFCIGGRGHRGPDNFADRLVLARSGRRNSPKSSESIIRRGRSRSIHTRRTRLRRMRWYNSRNNRLKSRLRHPNSNGYQGLNL